MEQLPDDVVLQVFRLVGVDDLFSCRLVCKRLGALALHPAVWRHRRFDGASYKFLIKDGPKKMCRLLRLAPRLASMTVSVKSTPDHHLALYATTRCAVRRLNLRVAEAGGVPAALIVRNQEALGQLKIVEVTFCTTWADAAVLLGALASTSVEKLDVQRFRLIGGLSAGSMHTSVARPSLKYFKCLLSYPLLALLSPA